MERLEALRTAGVSVPIYVTKELGDFSDLSRTLGNHSPTNPSCGSEESEVFLFRWQSSFEEKS